MSSNHKKKLEFGSENPSPLSFGNSPNVLALKERKSDQMEIEDHENTIFPIQNQAGLIVRKLDFSIAGHNLPEDGVYSMKISKGSQWKQNIIKAEIQHEIDNRDSFFKTREQMPENSANLSKVTLNTFNSFRLSSENKLFDMMDTKAQIEYQKQALAEIKKNYSDVPKAEKKNEESNSKKICCNCKKSRCLKLYCECFAAQKFCQDCNCLNCANLSNNCEERNHVMKAVMNRNPSAFKPKFEFEESQFVSNKMTVKHSKGCNCKKTLCSKKYCECYQAGIKCTELCKCEDCRNCEIQQCDKSLIYYHKMKHELEMTERQNIVKLEKNKNLFKNFVGVNNNKIKMNFFNSLGDRSIIKEEHKLFRDRNSSPMTMLKYEETH